MIRLASVMGLATVTACSVAPAQCPKASPTVSTAPTSMPAPALDEKGWKDAVESSASHVAYLMALAESVAKNPPVPGTKRYADCIADALGRFSTRNKGNPTYPAVLREADQEMTWCYSIHCAHQLIPRDDGKLQFEILCE